jgi:DNA-directed RNA polymerase specialized sigma24 family protein
MSTCLAAEHTNASSNTDIDAILVRYDSYISDLAKRFFPKAVAHPDVLDLEIDDLIQAVRIKLWSALRQKSVTHLGAYIRCIVQTEAIDRVRKHKRAFSLPISNEGELCQGTLLMSYSRGMQDPLYEIEQEEVVAEYVAHTVKAVNMLPRTQRQAMLCILKDRLEDVSQFVDSLREHEIDIEQVHWPEEKKDLQSYRSSLSIARHKLRANFSSDDE